MPGSTVAIQVTVPGHLRFSPVEADLAANTVEQSLFLSALAQGYTEGRRLVF